MGDPHLLRGVSRLTRVPLGLVVFDLDGTLVDSRRDLAESVNELLAERDLPTLSEESAGRMVGAGAATLVARAFTAAGAPAGPDALQRFLTIYHARLLKHTRPYGRIPELLATLAPLVPLAVLTNKPLAATRAILEGLDLARHVRPDRVVGGDGAFPRKPDPAGLQALARAAGVSVAATLLVGDSIVDVHTARAAGARLCLACYGFGCDDVARAELRVCDDTADQPFDVLAIVEATRGSSGRRSR